MKKSLVMVAVLLSCSIVFGASCLGWSTGYFAQYNGGNPSNIYWNAYTHICHFSLVPSSTGTLSGITAAQAQALVTACHQNKKKALICIGGAGTSPQFSASCANAATQTTLVKNIISFMKTYGYDGVDMDWECGEESDGTAMVAKFKALHKELRDSINKISPVPMMTAAVSNWYPNSCAAITGYCDQMNGMSYYGLVNTMDSYFATLTSRGVPKAKLGIGFGYDSDNEVDLNNPGDIAAKCKYSITNGYGGVMVWLIQRACTACNDTTANYICPSQTYAIYKPAMQCKKDASLFVQNTLATGRPQLRYTVYAAGSTGEVPVDLSLYDMSGTLIQTIVHGMSSIGTYVVPLKQNRKRGPSIRSGTYLVRLSFGSGRTEAIRSLIIE
jgi:hypothetical protein